MLWALFMVLLVAWLLAVVTAHTFGGLAHVLLILAVVVVVLRVIHGRRPID